MVYTPRKYLVPAAVALVAMQMQQAAAYSLYYGVETTSGTTDELSSKFPAFGADVADQDCAITIEVDPTLPDITTILTVPVTFTDLLANTTTAPTEPVFTKVGTAVVREDTPSDNVDQDAYTNQGSPSPESPTQDSTTPTAPATKTGITTPSVPTTKTGTTTPSAPTTNTGTTTTTTTGTTTTTPTAPSTKTGTTVQGGADIKDPNCATGWEEPKKAARKLRDSAVSGREIAEEVHQTRQLETLTNKDIAKLEAYFGTPMEKTLKNLPTSGVHTPSPWPAPYWPTYQDGINVVWSQGEPSPAEKYATAFGKDVTEFMDKVSADNGIDSQSKRKKCSSDNDCSTLTDGSKCAIRDGKSSGYCIPTWFGICHAWAPAAILEEEPKCPVT
ncbi:hypothetical protein G195_005728, partial [Phytophthora kernoviae 00238/432]